MLLSEKIYVAGHNGLVGSAILRLLKKKGYTNIITRTSRELDLRNQLLVDEFFQTEKPMYVFLAAAKVGGIMANQTYPADFIFDNLAIQTNVIHAAYKHNVEKLLFLGSSCIYPKNAPQPIKEEYLMTGLLEPTNAPYALAKIAGINMCQSYYKQYGCKFISVMPTNLYGPGDNYHLQNSHVLPALIRKFYEAVQENKPSVTIWGTGKPRREFLHVDDAAMACYFLMQKYDSPDIVNIGSGTDHTIKEIAEYIKDISGFSGELIFDESKPDGTPRKLLDVDKIHKLGWESIIELEQGIQHTYADFKQQYGKYVKAVHLNEPVQVAHV
ncbi:MAG TPA: GDP-L-fucose synthase [Ferruginibacter sp.]|nr:GDP-L-fucose synthase [Ferruginibacter sp.]HRO05224.1 GDP-L-fucose synthase [Ferruginibacter sp.]HRO95986.1 GDP-L-fucose synthase [Ferruginibacter sp.]HRP48679.1 GDP-L-fucose synthase [Ferruginibacter sp.]